MHPHRSVLNQKTCPVIHFHTNDLPFGEESGLNWKAPHFGLKLPIGCEGKRHELICGEWMGFDRGLFHQSVSVLFWLCNNAMRETIKQASCRTSDPRFCFDIGYNCVMQRTYTGPCVLLISQNKLRLQRGARRSMVIFILAFVLRDQSECLQHGEQVSFETHR